MENSPNVKRYYFPARTASPSRDELNVFEMNSAFCIVITSLDKIIVDLGLLKNRNWRFITSISFLINDVKSTIDYNVLMTWGFRMYITSSPRRIESRILV